MTRKLAIVGIAGVLAAVAAGLAVAAAGGGEQPLSGAALVRASDAALAHTGGGAIVETETGDDGAAYEVEVRLRSGNVVEVALDERFAVLGTEPDDDGAEGGEPDDD